MDYSFYVDQAKAILDKLFHDDADRDAFLDETLQWFANSPGEETGKLAYTLMVRVTGGQLPFHKVLDMHVEEPKLSRAVLDHDFEGGSDHARRYREAHATWIRSSVIQRVIRNLAPALALPLDLDKAKAHLATKAARMRRHPAHAETIDGLILGAGGKLVAMMATPGGLAELQAAHDRFPGGGPKGIAETLVDLVLPRPIPRETALGLMYKDGPFDSWASGVMQDFAVSHVADKIEQELKPELQRFFDLHGYPDPVYSQPLPGISSGR